VAQIFAEILGQVPGPRSKSSPGDLSRARKRRLRALDVSQTVSGPVYLIKYLEFGPRIRGDCDRLVFVRPSIIGIDIMDSASKPVHVVTFIDNDTPNDRVGVTLTTNP